MFDLSRANVHWFPSHMARGIQAMERKLAKIDLVLEVRDARIPFSSANPVLEQLSRGKKRLVVFNKADLGDPLANKNLAKYLKEHSQVGSMLLDADRRNEVTRLLERIKGNFMAEAKANPEARFKMIVAGMPNVGKSTIINRLRAIGTSVGGKAVRTGSLPGITRSVSEVVRISLMPRIYMLDTPGVLMPKITDPLVGLKIALTGGILDRAAGEYLVAEFLLHHLNCTRNTAYLQRYGLEQAEDNIAVLLPKIAAKLGYMEHGSPNISNTIASFLKHFRRGDFGHITLDDIPALSNASNVIK